MKIYSIHTGPLDVIRKSCIDRQRELYRDYTFISDYGVTREGTDTYRIEMIRKGGGYLDSDVYPNEAWEPTEDGIWIAHSWGRFDYWAIFNRNCNAYIDTMLETPEEKRVYMWPLRYFKAHPDQIRLIPQNVFTHHFLTTKQS